MRKLLLVLILFQSLQTIAQKISGIGFLRLNKTTIVVLDSLVKSSSHIYKEYQKGIVKDAPFIYNADSLEGDGNPQHKTFYLGTVNISGIWLNDIKLEFYKDTLYSILINKPTFDFITALNTKYPEAKETKKTKKVQCYNTYNTFNNEERTYNILYRSDSKVEAYIYMNIYYDSKCEEQTVHFFNIYDIKKLDAVYKKGEALKNKQKALSDEETKKALKDF